VCYCTWCAALVLLGVIGSGCGALCCRVRALLHLVVFLSHFTITLYSLNYQKHAGMLVSRL